MNDVMTPKEALTHLRSLVDDADAPHLWRAIECIDATLKDKTPTQQFINEFYDVMMLVDGGYALDWEGGLILGFLFKEDPEKMNAMCKEAKRTWQERGSHHGLPK